MSCYNREAGFYSLGTGEYKNFKKSFLKGRKECLELVAKNVSERVKELKAKKSAVIKLKSADWDARMDLQRALQDCNRKYRRYGYSEAYLGDYEFETFCDDLVSAGKSGTINNVTAKAIKEAIIKHEYSWSYVRFNDESKNIRWHVEENNRAVEQAREALEGSLFFELLGKVKWRAKQGGCIKYTDEYLEEDGPCEPDVRDAHGWVAKEQDRALQKTIKRYKRRAA